MALTLILFLSRNLSHNSKNNERGQTKGKKGKKYA
jgi:hypothetical protein